MARLHAAALALLLAGCAPPACSDAADREIAHDVELLVADDGPVGEAAALRLARRGEGVVPILETGLYRAETPARLRIVSTLGRLAAPTARPILEHLAQRDPSPEVREAARAALGAP